MMRPTLPRPLASLATVAALVATGLVTAAPASAGQTPLPTLQVVGRDIHPGAVYGTLTKDVFASTPTAIGNVRYDSFNCQADTSFLAVVDGALGRYDGAWTCDEPGVITSTTYTAGWGQMTQLVDYGYLYALHQNGRLYRYTQTAAGGFRSAGSVPGFGSVKSMALVHSDSRKQVLVMNLRGGSLYLVTLPVGPTMTATSVPLRSRSWNGFEQLVTVQSPNGTVDLMGIDTDTQAAYRYDLGPLKNSSSRITSMGQTNSTWPSALVQSIQYPEFPFLGAP